MKRHTLMDNLISVMIGCAIGIPFALYADSQRTHEVIVCYQQPIFQVIDLSETTVNREPVQVLEVIEPTPEELEEELFWDSVELLACCVEAEAGNQDIYGKKLVTDVILNRVDDPGFPDSIWDVITQPSQFSVVSNGSIYTVEPSDETYQAVREELESRTNNEVMFFCSSGWLPYGTQWQKIGDHYFNTK